MKHLSGLDATFLHLETAEMPMHVGGLNLFELPSGYQGSFYEDVKRHVAARMHLASIFGKKLALMPFEMANPVWIDDEAVDLDYHVRQIHLPKPGSMAQLEAYVGRLHSSLLDRSRPLWEFYVFEGLESGHVAFYSKIHHAALDGQGGAVLAQALLDISPVPREVPPPRPRRKGAYQPDVGQMVNAALRDTVQQSLRLLKGIPRGLKAAGGLLRNVREHGLRDEADSLGWSLAPKTPLNASLTNQRSFATLKLPLKESKFIAKTFEASLNDVVLAVCSGALRAWLAGKGALPSKTVVAAMPISLREEGNTELNNQVSMVRMQLASNIADPLKRLQTIMRRSQTLKRNLQSLKSVIPTDFPSLGLPWIMGSLVSFYGRAKLADKMHPLANLVISNVPGPQMDLYLAGAKMVTNFPVSIVAYGMGLNITVQSYAGALDFGMIACRKAMPDVQDFALMMQEAHDELLALAKARSAAGEPAAETQAAAKPRSVKKKAVQSKPAPAGGDKATEKAAENPAKKVAAKSAAKTAAAGEVGETHAVGGKAKKKPAPAALPLQAEVAAPAPVKRARRGKADSAKDAPEKSQDVQGKPEPEAGKKVPVRRKPGAGKPAAKEGSAKSASVAPAAAKLPRKRAASRAVSAESALPSATPAVLEEKPTGLEGQAAPASATPPAADA